jgi:hypothetical protein
MTGRFSEEWMFLEEGNLSREKWSFEERFLEDIFPGRSGPLLCV